MTEYVVEIMAAHSSAEHRRSVEVEIEATDMAEALVAAQAHAKELDGVVVSIEEALF